MIRTFDPRRSSSPDRAAQLCGIPLGLAEKRHRKDPEARVSREILGRAGRHSKSASGTGLRRRRRRPSGELDLHPGTSILYFVEWLSPFYRSSGLSAVAGEGLMF